MSLKPFFRLLILCLLAMHPSHAQSAPQQNPASTAPATPNDDSYASQRAFAMALFEHQHNLEALPIFESLATKNPNDPKVLLGWAAGLLAHSATIPDGPAAREERIRARNLLLRAKELGENSQMLLNLLELAPKDGSIIHDSNPDVDKAIQGGEAAFARNDYDEAIKQYSKAFELAPQNYSAVLFIGDSYFAKKDFPNAIIWYERAIQVNPDAETAYRYESDMLMKNGDMEKSRTRAIQAVAAAPYSQVTWRGLSAWCRFNHVQLTSARINTHFTVSSEDQATTAITVDPKNSAAGMTVWLVYAGKRVGWRKEEFKKRFPGEPQYRHTLEEESEALSLAASMLATQKPEAIAADPDLALLKKISDAKLIEPYILLTAPDREIAVDFAAYRPQHRAELEEYLSKFVVPPTPAQSKPTQ